MKNRDDIRDQFSPLLDGELTPDERAAVEAALSEDAELLRELDALKRMDDLYRALPAQTAPTNFEDAVRKRIRRPAARSDAGTRRPALWRRYWTVGLATAATLLIGVSAILFSTPRMFTEQFAKSTPKSSEVADMQLSKLESPQTPGGATAATPAPATAPSTAADAINNEMAAPTAPPVGTPLESLGYAGKSDEIPSQPQTSSSGLSDKLENSNTRMDASADTKVGHPKEKAKASEREMVPSTAVTGGSAHVRDESDRTRERAASAPAANRALGDAAGAPSSVTNGEEGTVASATTRNGALATDTPAEKSMPFEESKASAPQAAPPPMVQTEALNTPATVPPIAASAVESPAPAAPPASAAKPTDGLSAPAEPLAPAKKGAAEGDMAQNPRPMPQLKVADTNRPATTRTIGARTFTLRGGVWYESGYKDQATITVKRDSRVVRDLLKKYADVRNVVALEGAIVFNADGRWYTIQADPK